MSALLDLHPDPGHPGHPGVVVAAVHELLDTLGPLDLDPAKYAGTVTDVDRALRRLESLKLRLVAAAAKADVPQQSGARSTGDWLSKQTNTGSAPASRESRLADDLDGPLTEVGDALAAGEISTTHAAVIAHTMRHLPDHLADPQREAIQIALVRKAHKLTPDQLRKVARRAIEAVEPDTVKVDAEENTQVQDEEDTAWDKARFSLHDNGDGTTTGHFTVPTLAAMVLKKVLDAMTAPRRTRESEPVRDWAQARGQAFAQVLEHLPVDHLHGKVAATIVITLDLDTLRDKLKTAGLDTGDLVSAAHARRLACNAALIPAVLDGTSQPLDLGREKRLFNQTQRLAGATRHSTCAAAGCDIPYAWCELHHRRPWTNGGRTDLNDMIPLCGHHHRRLHAGGLVPLRT